ADKFNSNRRKNAERLLEGLGGIKGLLLPIIKDNNNHVFHQFTIRITEEFKTSRQEFMDYLKSHGVGCGVYYPKPLHLHPHFMDMGYKKGDFPVSERMSEQVLSLPVHPSLSDENMDYIIKVIRDYVR
ncbi:MAG: aminotransferase DegT, partial [Candidatus Magasanikbacteria bacterium CG10_big_fil_rev_8_21_14_0_10_38_6]